MGVDLGGMDLAEPRVVLIDLVADASASGDEGDLFFLGDFSEVVQGFF